MGETVHELINKIFQEKIFPFWKTHRISLIIGSLGIGVIIIACLVALIMSRPAEPIKFSSSATILQKIRVDIEGAVVNPGVIELPIGSRVEDAINAAGGLTQEADNERIAKTINRATPLVDGAKLYFWKIGESGYQTAPGQAGSAGSANSASSIQTGNVAGVNNNLININSATLSELDTLPGIGPVTAQKIIDNRPYQTLEELVSKKAVSASVFAKIKEKITL